MSLRDWLLCFEDSVGMTLLAALFLLPLTICFLRACLPTLFAAVVKFFLLLTSSSISVASNSNKWEPTRFAAGTILSRENGIVVLPITFGSAPNPRSRCRPLTSIEWNLHLSWSNHLVTSFRLKNIVRRFSEYQKNLSTGSRLKGFVSLLLSLTSMWILWKNCLSSGFN